MSALLLLTLLLLLSVHVKAADDLWGSGSLTEALPESAREFLEDADAEHMGSGVWEKIASAAREKLRALLAENLTFSAVVLCVVLLCSAAEAADGAGRSKDYVMLAGVASIGAAAVSDVNSYMTVGAEALQSLLDYSRVLLPVMAGTASVSGSVTAAASKCALTAIFMDVLLELSGSVIIPLVCGYASLSLANAAVGNDALKTAAGLLKNLCTTLLTAVATVFTLWISTVSVISGSADAAASRLTKTVLTSALPVVGKVLSDAAGSLSAAAASLRATAGAFGMAAVLCLCLTPVLELGVRYMLYKVTAAICQCLCGGRLSALLDALGSCFGMLLSTLGTGAVLLYVSLYSLMRVIV